MATQDSNTHSIERCTNEIPLGQNDAVVCGSLSDVMTEAGPRCWSCFQEYGGTLVSEASPATEPKPVIRVDFGLTMATAIDRLFPSDVACIGNGIYCRVGKKAGRK